MTEVIDALLKKVLTRTRIIAVVGFSPDPSRPSHGVAAFLHRCGYRVLPVNPGQSGKIAFGEVIWDELAAIGEPVDMIDIFRRSEHVLPIVEQALATFPALQTVWMQIGVNSAVATALAQARGVTVIADRCPKIEYARLFGNRTLAEIAAR